MVWRRGRHPYCVFLSLLLVLPHNTNPHALNPSNLDQNAKNTLPKDEARRSRLAETLKETGRNGKPVKFRLFFKSTADEDQNASNRQGQMSPSSSNSDSRIIPRFSEISTQKNVRTRKSWMELYGGNEVISKMKKKKNDTKMERNETSVQESTGTSATQWLENAIADTVESKKGSGPKLGRRFSLPSMLLPSPSALWKSNTNTAIKLSENVAAWANRNRPSGSSAIYSLTTVLTSVAAWHVWSRNFNDHGILRGFLLHAALAGLAISIASTDTLNYVQLLGKRPDGEIQWWSYFAFMPFHVLYRLRLHARRALISEALSDTSSNGSWHISGWPHDQSALPPLADAVVDCTCELPRQYPVGPQHKVKHYRCVPLWDAAGPSPEQMDSVANWAADLRKKNHSVLVHCAHGHGRSATVLAAAMLCAGEAPSCVKAFQQIKAFRPKARMNGAQRQSLREWARKYNHQWDDEAVVASMEVAQDTSAGGLLEPDSNKGLGATSMQAPEEGKADEQQRCSEGS
mmetsp:Transcript_26625/g.36874  ORF Transcript_26625/g.36874 Transcript_26625/m.36874 type:complete len:516 (-) Transcript_26625:143-1690(-)